MHQAEAFPQHAQAEGIKEIGGENKWETEKDNVRDIQQGDRRRGQAGH